MKTLYISSNYFKPNDFMKHLDTTYILLTKNIFKVANHIDFIYFDHTTSKNIKSLLYKKTSNFTSALKVIGPNFTDKGDLHEWLKINKPKIYNEYFMKQEYYSPNSPSNLFKQFKNKMVIVKPIPGFAGLGVKVFNNTNKVTNYINKFKNPKNKEYMPTPQKWVMQEYISKPLLLEGRKFHMRVTLLAIHDLSNKTDKLYMHKHSLMFPAKHKYNTKSLNMNIHNTHGELTESHEKRLFPRDFITEYGKDKTTLVNKQLNKMLKDLKKANLFKFNCYNDTKKCCFEFYGMDVMVTDDFKIKCIEINHKPGLKRFLKHMPHLISGLLDLTLLNKNKGKDYKKI
jgi:hypothetical protein